MASYTSMAGYEVRVLVGQNPIGVALSLVFENQTEVAALSITNHYATAKGTYEVFALPPDVFAGMANYSSVKPEMMSWRYAAAPSVEWLMPGVATVSVELVAVYD